MAVVVSIPTSIEHECRCGESILPYIIGKKTFYASFCPDCIEKNDALFEEEKQREKQAHLGYQKRYRNADFDNLHDPKPPEHIIEAVRLYALEMASEVESSGQGLYLWGPNGTGKTHLAVAITRTVKGSTFLNTLQLFDALKESYATKEPCKVFEQARWCKLLVLDDIGSERPSGWIQERLYALLNTRWDEMLPTVFTSNYSPKNLERHIDEDIPRSASRILANCISIEIDGPDHRRFACAQL